MKISELNNAPQWLIDARTENADVGFIDGRVVWRGGDWRGGVWRGGDWRGGVWLGGVWRVGDWHGGVWHGGVWRGGVWHGGFVLGTAEKTNPQSIYGLKWPITISSTKMQIGCECKTHEEWRDCSDADINKLDRGALKWWRQHKELLMAFCEKAKS
jgi:hypothetical protein